MSGWSSVRSRRRIASAFSYSGWACGVLPLGEQVGRQVVVGSPAVLGVVVGQEPAADLQRLLEQRLGLRRTSPALEVLRQVVVAQRGFGVVVGQSSRRRIESAFSNSGWAVAYFRWVWRLVARPKMVLAVSR